MEYYPAFKKKGKFDIRYNKDEFWGHHTKGNKPEQKDKYEHEHA